MSDKPYIPTVADSWRLFADAIPASASRDTVTNMRRAFYAGVRIAFEITETVINNTDSEHRAGLELELIKSECDAFSRLIQQGKA